MQTPILQESNYKEEMQTIVEPYLVSIGTEFYLERHAGQKIHCMHYVPENRSEEHTSELQSRE